LRGSGDKIKNVGTMWKVVGYGKTYIISKSSKHFLPHILTAPLLALKPKASLLHQRQVVCVTMAKGHLTRNFRITRVLAADSSS
jgi:hypothetical protein